MGMKNLDLQKQERDALMAKMHKAVESGDTDQFQQAMTEFSDFLQEAVLAEAKGLVSANDNTVLMGRGIRPLTSQETKYYEQVVQAMKSSDPKQALTLIDEVMPTTVIDAILDDISETHPLLSEINFQSTGAMTEILVSVLGGRFLATWGELCDEIVKEVAAGFKVIPLTGMKLSAFIPICKAMLEVGPVWIDRYVRAILAEAIANGLEKAIILGTGVKEPVGMTKDVEGDFNSTTGYPDLEEDELEIIDPATYGTVIAGLAESENGLQRNINEVILVVNPVDALTLINPAVSHLVNGSWVQAFPFPTKVIQSVFVPSKKAIIGLGKRYFFGLGTSRGGKIEYSDENRFLEDQRVYLTKLYGNGMPLDNKSFKVLDIKDLKAYIPTVNSVPEA